MGFTEFVESWGYMPTMLASVGVYLVCFFLISPWIRRNLLRNVFKKELTLRQKVDWDSRLGSTINALVVIAMCVRNLALEYNHKLRHDPIRSRDFFTQVVASHTVGYFFADAIVIMYHWDKIGDLMMMVHHMTYALGITWVSCIRGFVVYFGYLRAFGEISTPSVNLRWYLETLKVSKSSKIFLTNGVILTTTFFFFRIAAMPYYYFVLYQVLKLPTWTTLDTSVKIIFFAGSFTTDILNFMWMRKIVLGCVKLLTTAAVRHPSAAKASSLHKPRGASAKTA